MRTICGAGIALFIGVVGSTARAETTVSVLGIQALDAPTDVATRLAAALKRRVNRAPGMRLIKGKNLDEIKLVFGCVNEQPECMARVGRNLQAAKLLWGTLRTADGGYMLSLRFLDVASEKIEQSIEQPLTKDDATRAAETVAQVTAALFPAEQGSIRVSSNVVGAEIFVSDVPRGRTTETPFVVQALPPGDHVVAVRKKGYGMWKMEVRVRSGVTAEIDATLEPLAGVVPPPPPPTPRTRPRRPRRPHEDPRDGWKVAFWSAAAVTVGLGVGLAVTGISVLDLEDDKDTEIYRLLNEPVVTLAPEVEEALTVGDACSTGNKGSNALRDICSAGDTREDIVNGLIAGTAVAAAVAAFFLYKAYIQKGSAAADREQDGVLEEEARSSVRLTTGISPQGGHVGLTLSF